MRSIEEKLAARRKELAEQEAAAKRQDADLHEKMQHALCRWVQEEINSRDLQTIKFDSNVVSTATHSALSDEALRRFYKAQVTLLIFLGLLLVYGFIQAWWFGALVLILIGKVFNSSIEEHEKEIQRDFQENPEQLKIQLIPKIIMKIEDEKKLDLLIRGLLDHIFPSSSENELRKKIRKNRSFGLRISLWFGVLVVVFAFYQSWIYGLGGLFVFMLYKNEMDALIRERIKSSSFSNPEHQDSQV